MKTTRIFLLAGTVFLGGSWGLAQDALIPFKSNWRYLKGTVQQPAAWRDVSFNDSLWPEGALPIGYGPSGYMPANSTMLTDMQNNYFSVFIRHRFEIADPFPIAGLSLHARIDDGFVAYLNGQYVAHRNMPATNNPPYNTAANATVGGQPEEVEISLSAHVNKLLPGTNVFSVQVHNVNLTSSDLFFDMELKAEYRAQPFVCLAEVGCVDLGDGVVHLSWVLPLGARLDTIEVREDNQVVLEVPGAETSAQLAGVFPGVHTYRFFGKQTGVAGECYGGMCIVDVSPVKHFIRGDVNVDGAINIVDPLVLAHYLFQGGPDLPCHDAADIDDSGVLNIADVIALLDYLFKGGVHPPAPGPLACGPDETLDTLPICEFILCD